MQCVFAASLGTLLAAVYFRTGNIWVTVFIHAAMDITSMLVGGLYGTQSVADSISTYDITMLASVAVYLIPTAFLLRKRRSAKWSFTSDGMRCQRMHKKKEPRGSFFVIPYS